MRNSTRLGLYLASAIAAALSAPAFAQDTATSDDAQRSAGVKEIVVTAQRKGESVLDVPLSIQATSGDQLSNSGIRQMSDLQFTTPGFLPSNSNGYNQMFIRGVGNSIFVGADPSVATFIDDVPRVFGTMVNNFVDVERVEVIKGAPGALYGRNATGGAVNIITRQPSTEGLSGKGRISFGEKDTFQASAFLNVPLGDKLAWTIAGERRSHDFYIRNLTPDTNAYSATMFPVNNVAGPGTASFLGTPTQTAAVLNSGLVAKKGYNNEDFWAVSSKLLFRPTDNFKITLAGDYSKKDDDTGNGAYNGTPGYPVAVLSGLINQFIGARTTPALMSSLIVPVGKFQSAQRTPGYARLKDWGLSATAVLELPGVDITSITAYRKNQSRFLSEFAMSPYALFQANVDIDKKAFYQELRAVSNGEGPLSYIVGASYLRAQFDGLNTSNVIPPLVFKAPAGEGGYLVSNWSAYAQLGYDLTQNLNLTASGRYIHERNTDRPAPGVPVRAPLTEKKFLPSATLSYKLDTGGNIYARWARGFKAGGVVPEVDLRIFPDPYTQGGIFKGEDIDTFEVGVRTPLLDRKVNLTAAVFYNDYRNVQVSAHANLAYQQQVSIAVVNAGSARTYGAEIGINARVAEPLTIGATAGYLNAKYKRLSVPASNPVLQPFDLSGTRMINAPEWQMSFNADLDQPITDNLGLVGNVVASYTSDVLWQQSGFAGVLPDSVGKSFWLVNARLGIKSGDDKWELAAYAKNLFNSSYTTFGSSAAAFGTIYLWGDPRIIGAEAILKF